MDRKVGGSTKPHLEDIKKKYDLYYPKLVKILPMDDVIFRSYLKADGLFGKGDLKDIVEAQPTTAQAATKFLDKAISLPIKVDDDLEPLYKLLRAMEEFDGAAGTLAKKIKEAISYSGQQAEKSETDEVETSEKEHLIVTPESFPRNPSSQGGQQAEKPETDEEKLKQLYDKRDFEGSVIKGNVNINDLKEQPKVLIQTVNDIEYYAVMLQLKEGSKAVRYIKEDSDSYYLVGEWGESGIPVVIIKTSQGHDGPRGSNEETREALKWFPDLKYIFAVGVCGGVEGKVNLGDVVVSTTIQGYYKAKQKRGEHTNRSPCWLVYRRTTFHDFLSRAADNVKCGIVLSADNLMADRDFQKHLLKEYKEAIAFEMEGHGIADACDIVASKKKIVYMVVKGVSDLADEDKDDDWQPEAATNAAKALCKAMEDSKFFGGPSTQATKKPAKKKQPGRKPLTRKRPARKQPARKAPTHGKQDGPPVPKKAKRTA